MASVYRFQIVHAETGEVVYEHTPLSAHIEIIDNLKHRVRAKNVGLGRTKEQVVTAVGEAMHEMLIDLKQAIPPPRVG